jgi:hypothetical protein
MFLYQLIGEEVDYVELVHYVFNLQVYPAGMLCM